MGKLKGVVGKKGTILNPQIPNSEKHRDFNYPVFCFRHMVSGYDLSECEKDDKAVLIDKLHMLSQMEWIAIHMASREGHGTEKINRNAFRVPIPSNIPEDITFYRIRFHGKKPIIGYKTDFVFHIIWIDVKFSVYDHG